MPNNFQNKLLKEMSDAGVFIEDEGAISITPEFKSSVSADVPAACVAMKDVEDRYGQILSVEDLAIASALADHLRIDDSKLIIRALITYNRVKAGPVPSTGSPKGFVPVGAEELEIIISVFESCVIYVWLEECAPCDRVKEHLEVIFADPPVDVLGLAVFGPDHAQILEAEFEVVGGPTLLFTRSGRIDSRLVGLHRKQVIINELDKITPEMSES